MVRFISKHHYPDVGRDRRAFTIVELLVVIAIIGVLVSILLPAVNAARVAANRAQDSNNLHQIGIAIQSYVDAKKTFPPLVRYPSDAPKNSTSLERAVSWAFEILPYIEQQVIYDRLDQSKQIWHANNQIAMSTPVEAFANPMRRDAVATSPFLSQSGTGACLDYAANGGVVMDTKVSPPVPVKLPNDPSKARMAYPYQMKFDPRYSGPFHHDLAVPPAAVKDGLGNTLGVGDRWIGPPVQTTGSSSTAKIWNDLAGMAGESFPSLVRYANPDDQSAAGLPFPVGKTDTSIYKFGGVGSTDACFVFLDAHVKWLSYEMDRDIYLRLASINDGLPVPPIP